MPRTWSSASRSRGFSNSGACCRRASSPGPASPSARWPLRSCSRCAPDATCRRSTSTREPSPTAFASERHLRVDGQPIPLFAPLSGFWRAADGWVRTHANYPHHRARLLTALDLPDTGDDTDLAHRLAAAINERPAVDVQETVYAAGGLAVAVAPPGRFDKPLVTVGATGGARRLPGPGHSARAGRPRPRPHARPGRARRHPDAGAARRGRPAGRRPVAARGRRHAPRHRFGKRTTRLALDDAADHAAFDRLLFNRRTSSSSVTAPARWTATGSAPTRCSRASPGWSWPSCARGGGTDPRPDAGGSTAWSRPARASRSLEGTDAGRPGTLPAQALEQAAGLPRGSGGPAGAHHPDGHRRPASTCGCRWWAPRRGCSGRRRRDGAARLVTAGRRVRGRCARALAGRDRLPVRTAAARSLSRRCRGRPDRLDPAAAQVGHGRAALGGGLG